MLWTDESLIMNPFLTLYCWLWTESLSTRTEFKTQTQDESWHGIVRGGYIFLPYEKEVIIIFSVEKEEYKSKQLFLKLKLCAVCFFRAGGEKEIILEEMGGDWKVRAACSRNCQLDSPFRSDLHANLQSTCQHHFIPYSISPLWLLYDFLTDFVSSGSLILLPTFVFFNPVSSLTKFYFILIQFAVDLAG